MFVPIFVSFVFQTIWNYSNSKIRQKST